MTVDLELITQTMWTDDDFRSAVREVWARHELAGVEITGTFPDDLLIEVASNDQLDLQLSRPRQRTTSEGEVWVTEIAMAASSSDTLVVAAMDLLTALARTHHGHVAIDGEALDVEGTTTPDQDVSAPATAPEASEQQSDAVPTAAPVFAAVLLDVATPGVEGWQSLLSAVGGWVAERGDWLPGLHRPDDDWEPFSPTTPPPAHWPGVVRLFSSDGATAEWYVSGIGFPRDLLASLDVALRVPPRESPVLLDRLEVLEPWRPVYAVLHPWHPMEPFRIDGPRLDRQDQVPAMSITARGLTEGIPNLYWANVFGPPWVELIGADRLARTPAHRVEEVLPGRWLVQLTSSIDDVRDDWEGFNRVRDECKEHLGADLFREPELDYLAPRRVTLPTLAERGIVTEIGL